LKNSEDLANRQKRASEVRVSAVRPEEKGQLDGPSFWIRVDEKKKCNGKIKKPKTILVRQKAGANKKQKFGESKSQPENPEP